MWKSLRLAGLAGILIVLSGCSPGTATSTSSASGAGEQAVQAATVTAATETVTVWDEYVGRFQATDRVELRPRVSGYVEAVYFDDGQTVEAGQQLYTIDPRPFQAVLARANADVMAAETQISLSQSELKRAGDLLAARAGSQEEYDRRLQAASAAEASLAAAKAVRRQAALDLEYTDVKSAIAGRVSEDRIGVGNYVAAGQTVMTVIVSVDPIEFAFSGSEQDFLNYLRLDRAGLRGSSITTPNPVRIKLADEDAYTIEGQMKFIDNEIDAGTSTISALAVVDNADGFLTPGLFGRLQLYGQDPFDAVIIPEAAVQFDQNRRFVWVLDEASRARQQEIGLGRDLEDGRRIVSEGLTGGEQVVVGNLFMMRPGLLVEPVSRPDTAPPGSN